VSKPLEPSPGQREQIVDAIGDFAGRLSKLPGYYGIALSIPAAAPGIVETVWPLIRDMALEAAALECERVPERVMLGNQPAVGCNYCADAVRALKGPTA
jgi:hypothetical protein